MNELNCSFTEKEGLLFLIEKGVPKAEAKFNSFMKHNKLKTKPMIKAFVENLEMYLHEVSYSGEGQSREYSHKGLKENLSERITGNSTNGKKPTEEDEILKEYFFAQLVRRIKDTKKGWSETYNLWGRNWISQLSVSDMEWAKFETKLKKTFSSVEMMDEKRLNELSSNIKDNLNRNTRSLAIKSIERLEKENRIRTEIEFFEAIAKGSYVEAMLKESIEEDEVIDYHNKISESMQMRIANEINEKLLPFEMTYKHYKVVSAFPQFATPEEKEAIQAIGEWLFDEYSIDYLYSRIRIFVIDPDSKQDINKKQAEKAFINRLIYKTNARMNRKDYKTTHKFQNTFYRLSMFLLLDIKEVEGLKETILNEKRSLETKISECVFQYALKYGEKYEEPKEERTVYGFGTTSLDKPENALPLALKDVDITKLFEDNKPVVVNSELEWMNRFPPNLEKRERILNTKPSAKKPIKPIKSSNYIDIEAIVDEPEPIKVEKQYNRVFGSTFIVRDDVIMEEWRNEQSMIN